MRAQPFVSKLLLVVLLVSGFSCVLVAMQGGSPAGLILVPVSVTDAKNVPITTLKQEHFQVLEDNKEQKITQFSSASDPLTLSVVLGLSANGPIKTPGQKDRASVELLGAVDKIREANPNGPLAQNPFDGDGMFETVIRSMNDLGKNPSPKKAMVIVSDGYIASGSQASSLAMPKTLIENSKVAPFPIYFLFASSSTNSLPGFTEGSTYGVGYYLQQVADYSGGESLAGQTENNLTKVSTDLRDSLKTLYFLGYQSTNNAKDGKWRKLTIKVTPPADVAKVKVNAKPRYFVPKG
jgi:Ca-activated chloride channel family protein